MILTCSLDNLFCVLGIIGKIKNSEQNKLNSYWSIVFDDNSAFTESNLTALFLA
jgi:hypothetical protein